eukprot:2577455-Rhodomonas_salina.1
MRSWLGPQQFVLNSPSARTGAAMCEYDGRIFLFGGLSEDEGLTSDLNMLDMEARSWMPVSETLSGMPPAGREGAGHLKEVIRCHNFSPASSTTAT